MALKRTHPEINICGVDINYPTIQIGIETKCIDWGTLDVVEGVGDADMVIICTLTSSIKRIAQNISAHLKPGSLVTDVGSTKELIANNLYEILPEKVYYVPGHPMAGSEAKGIEGADSYLFENAAYILTPTPQTNQKALNTLKGIITAIGAKVLELSPQEHDLKVAAISHMPHVIASALVNGVSYLEEDNKGVFQLSAGGFRDLTRIADSQPEMWQDIFMQNKEGVLHSIGYFQRALDKIKQAIIDQDKNEILNFLQKSTSERQKVPAKAKGILPGVYELVVTVADRPGIIGEVASLLGDADLNIADIEILRVREGDGGTIRFGFGHKEIRDRAFLLLKEKGYLVKVRN